MNRFFGTSRAAILIVLTLGVFWAGCSGDDPVVQPPPPEVDLLTIICNPLSPMPGQTAELTVQGTGSGGMGTYQWQVGGGTIVDNGTINVNWETPATPGIYRVSVKATVGTATDTASTYVMLRATEAVETGIRYSLFPNIVDGALYFIGSSVPIGDRLYYGCQVYRMEETALKISDSAIPRVDGCLDVTFRDEGVLTSSTLMGLEFVRQQSVNVIVFPYFGTTKRYVTNNETGGTALRKNQHLHPVASADMDMFVWQFEKVGAADDGTQDLTNIAFRAGTLITDPIQILTTGKDSIPDSPVKYFKNIKPSFTPGDESILYFTEKGDWYEPCIIPIIEGNEPDTASRYLIAAFRAAEVKVGEGTVFEWNPAVPTEIGFIDTQGKLCIFDYVSQVVDIVETGISEFAWSADGKLAFVNAAGISVLEPGQAVAEPIFVKERSSDDCVGVNWSPGTSGQKVGFRLVRKGASTLETFSALVIYSVDDGRWYYATPRIASSSDPEVNFTWLRVAFDEAGGGAHMAVPIPGGSIVIYYSH